MELNSKKSVDSKLASCKHTVKSSVNEKLESELLSKAGKPIKCEYEMIAEEKEPQIVIALTCGFNPGK